MRPMFNAVIILVLISAATMAAAVTICMQLSAQDASTVADAFAVTQQYQATVVDPACPTPGGPTPALGTPTPCSQVANPETKAAFAQRQVRIWTLRNVSAAQDINARATAAAVAALTPTPAIQ